MIGKSRSVRINDFVEDKVEKLKKVDIDFFSNGDREGSAYKYKLSMYRIDPMLSLVENDTADLKFKAVLPDGYTLQDVRLEGTQLSHTMVKTNEYLIHVNVKVTEGVHNLLILVRNRSGEDEVQAAVFYAQVTEETKHLGKHIPVVSYRDSLLNVTKLWLLSRSYDRVRNPSWAGFFDRLLREYPMTEDGARQIESALLTEIGNKIPDVVITEVKAIPDVVNKGWRVSVKSIDTETNISTQFDADSETFVTISDKATL